MSSRRTRIGAAISWLIAAGWIACNPDNPNELKGDTTGLPAPAGEGPSDASSDARALFKALESELANACQQCHDAGGVADAPFLRSPNLYEGIVSYPGIVRRDPAQSLLLTYPRLGNPHSPTLDSDAYKDTLLPKIQAWLEAEAKNLTEPPAKAGPHIEPLVPIMGYNSVYLEALDPSFEGMAVTFRAAQLDATTLELTDIAVHPSAKLGLHIVHPLFVVHPLGKEPVPDPIDSFSNIDQTFETGKSSLLSPGTLILTSWSTDARISLAFEKIAVHVSASPSVDGGCKNLLSFETNARDRFIPCSMCHDGTDGQATAAVDMSGLFVDSAKACAQIRNRVNPADPPASHIFVTTDPAVFNAHPFKFKGNADMFANFRNAVSVWIAAEN